MGPICLPAPMWPAAQAVSESTGVLTEQPPLPEPSLQTASCLLSAAPGSLDPPPSAAGPQAPEEPAGESLWSWLQCHPVTSGLHRWQFPQSSLPPPPFQAMALISTVNVAEAARVPPSSLRPFRGQPPTAISCISLHECFLQKPPEHGSPGISGCHLFLRGILSQQLMEPGVVLRYMSLSCSPESPWARAPVSTSPTAGPATPLYWSLPFPCPPTGVSNTPPSTISSQILLLGLLLGN